MIINLHSIAYPSFSIYQAEGIQQSVYGISLKIAKRLVGSYFYAQNFHSMKADCS